MLTWTHSLIMDLTKEAEEEVVVVLEEDMDALAINREMVTNRETKQK